VIAACVLAYLLLAAEIGRLFTQARGIDRRLQRILTLPLFTELERASASIERLSFASSELPLLVARAVAAVARIRALIVAIRRYLPSSSSSS
jgi:hypothetical protein